MDIVSVFEYCSLVERSTRVNLMEWAWKK